MKLIVQEDLFGCAPACVACILDLNYSRALRIFKNGKKYVRSMGFFCSEIVEALRKTGREYEYRHINSKIKKRIYLGGTIVFIKRSTRYPVGHYLCRAKNKWMDPWINFPNLAAKAGFRKRLPGKPIYAILKKT